MAMSRTEEMLTAIIEGKTVDFEPRSRAEQYLKNCIDKCGCDGLPAPRSRMEALLYELSEELANGGGGIPDGYIKPAGSVSITENGTHNVKEYETANVNVSIPSDYIKPSGSLEITENGTVDVKYYETANVNVPVTALIKVGEMTVSFTKTEIDCTSYANYDKWTKDDFYLVPKAFTVFSTTEGVTKGEITLGTYSFSQSYSNGKFSASRASVTGQVGLQFPCEVYVYDKTGANIPIPDGYIKPSGSVEYTENGTYDVTDKAEVVVNVASSGGDTLKTLLDATKSTYYLFNNYKGTSVDGLIPYSATENVTNMKDMFYGCPNLTTVTLFNTSSAKDMSYMFYNCANLTAVPLFDTSNVTYMEYMFFGCTNLTTVTLFNTSNVTEIFQMFRSCKKLKKVKLQGVSSKIINTTQWFYNCTSLEVVDFRGATGVPTLSDTNAFYNVPTTCKVVIPDSLYDTWTNATNWSAISVTWVKESEYVEE